MKWPILKIAYGHSVEAQSKRGAAVVRAASLSSCERISLSLVIFVNCNLGAAAATAALQGNRHGTNNCTGKVTRDPLVGVGDYDDNDNVSFLSAIVVVVGSSTISENNNNNKLLTVLQQQ